jgi:hypothetical protein
LCYNTADEATRKQQTLRNGAAAPQITLNQTGPTTRATDVFAGHAGCSPSSPVSRDINILLTNEESVVVAKITCKTLSSTREMKFGGFVFPRRLTTRGRGIWRSVMVFNLMKFVNFFDMF